MADLVVGERPSAHIARSSPLKKLLQKLGSVLVRVLSRTDIRDAPSGFRAMSCAAAMELNVFSEDADTLETTTHRSGGMTQIWSMDPGTGIQGSIPDHARLVLSAGSPVGLPGQHQDSTASQSGWLGPNRCDTFTTAPCAHRGPNTGFLRP